MGGEWGGGKPTILELEKCLTREGSPGSRQENCLNMSFANFRLNLIFLPLLSIYSSLHLHTYTFPLTANHDH